jgi:glycopeptide antibiotics resistance protein
LKSKVVYIAVVITVIMLGLGSRVFAEALPSFVANHFGDMLWASIVYFGFRVLLSNRSLLLSAYLSLIFSFSVEFSQLYQAGWINEIRSTTLGALVLGRGFLFVDLIRYTVGIALSFVADRYCFKRNKRANH